MSRSLGKISPVNNTKITQVNPTTTQTYAYDKIDGSENDAKETKSSEGSMILVQKKSHNSLSKEIHDTIVKLRVIRSPKQGKKVLNSIQEYKKVKDFVCVFSNGVGYRNSPKYDDRQGLWSTPGPVKYDIVQPSSVVMGDDNIPYIMIVKKDNGSQSPTKKTVHLYLPICNQEKELLFIPKLSTLLEFQKEKTFICVSENGVAFRNTAIYEDRYTNSTYPRVNKPNHPLAVVMGDGKL